MKTKVVILSIDPGHREMGIAHFIGSELVDYGVKSLRRTGQLSTRVLSRTIRRLLDEKTPDILAIEENNFEHLPQNESVMRAFKIILNIAKARDLQTYAFAPSTVKKVITGDGRATKRAIAQVVCSQFPYLKPFKNTGKRWKDGYHQNMFDAIAVGLAYLKLSKDNKL